MKSNHVQTQNSTLIEEFQRKLDLIKQHDLANNIIIVGLPQTDPHNVVNSVIKNLNADLSSEDIDESKILRKISNNENRSKNNIDENENDITFLVSFKNIKMIENFMNNNNEKKIILIRELKRCNRIEKDKIIHIRDHIINYKLIFSMIAKNLGLSTILNFYIILLFDFLHFFIFINTESETLLTNNVMY